MQIDNPIFSAVLQESALLFLIIGSVFALLLGILFIFSPQQATELSQRYNRWLSLRKPLRPLEIPRNVDHLFYRQHRAIGLVLLISATYILYQFAFDYRPEQAKHALIRLWGHPVITEWLLDALLWILLPASLLVALFGTLMAIKPSALKRLENLANRWVSTRKSMQPIEKSYDSLDAGVTGMPRLFGVFLILAAGYNLVILLIFFLKIFA